MRSEKQRKDGDLNREETLSKRHQQTKGNPRHEGGEHLSLESQDQALSFFFDQM